MARLTFDQAVEAMGAFSRMTDPAAWVKSLDRMNRFVDSLGLRGYVTGEERPMYFHVAGTNGKGSVTCMIQSLSLEHGLAVGACASPFVYDVRERVQFGRELISHDEWIEGTEALLAAGEGIGPSEFEMKTALGFWLWHKKGANAVALETGMGGRLDATNVVEPAASIIVSIGWDHMEHLGDTLGKIAGEKAGILKPGRPAILGDLPAEAMEVAELAARENGCAMWRTGKELTWQIHDDGSFDLDTPAGSWKRLRTKLYGTIQVHNAALSIGALAAAGVQLEDDALRRGLALAVWPGRFEEHVWRGIQVVLDGAHNEPAAAALAGMVRQRFSERKIGAVAGMLKGHDPAGFLRELGQVASEVRLVSSPGERGQTAKKLAESAPADAKPCASILEAMESLAQEGCEAILITGSFYLLGQAKAELGLA